MDIFSLPFDSHGNQYFFLWREALSRTGQGTVRPVPKGGLVRLFFTPSEDRPHILVIHWSTTLYGSRFIVKSSLQLFVNSILLCLLKIRGWTLIWVMHNAYAHDYPHPLIDRVGRALLSSVVSAIVVHQEQTQKKLSRKWPRKRIVYIPHGNYIGVYGPRIQEKRRIREHYGFAPDDRIILAFGMIRPYKGLEKIIDSFGAASSAFPDHLILWILGKGNAQYVESLNTYIGSANGRIRIENRFVPDSEVPECFAISDYSIFYYDESELTSGGIVLSLSYGVPVITRTIPAAEIIKEGENGYLFTNVADLSRVFLRLASVPTMTPDSVMDTVKFADWDSIARAYGSLCGEIKKSRHISR